jgi:phosphonate transport system substrate-binding protein
LKDTSILTPTRKLVDGAAVDSLIWEYYNKTNPDLTSKTRVVMKSEPYGIPPVVIAPNVDPEIKKQVSEILLNMHNEEKGKAILDGMMLEKFVTSNNSDYDSIRKMFNGIRTD